MNRRRAVGGVLAVAALTPHALGAGPTTQPATRSATRPATTTTGPATTQATAVVEPAAVATLNRLAAVYTAAGPLHTTGDLVGRFDVAGRSRTFKLHVDGRTDGVGRFVHDAGAAGLIVSDGVAAYLYDRRRDAFATLDAAPGRLPAADVSDAVLGILLDENPALLLTLTDDPAALLRRAAKKIRLERLPATAPATTTAAATSPSPPPAALILELSDKVVTFRLNAAGEVVSSDIDYAPLMAARHAVAVKAATVTLTYTPATHKPPPADAFTWRPPESATEFDAGDDLVKPKPATKPAATRPATTGATTTPIHAAT